MYWAMTRLAAFGLPCPTVSLVPVSHDPAGKASTAGPDCLRTQRNMPQARQARLARRNRMTNGYHSRNGRKLDVIYGARMSESGVENPANPFGWRLVVSGAVRHCTTQFVPKGCTDTISESQSRSGERISAVLRRGVSWYMGPWLSSWITISRMDMGGVPEFKPPYCCNRAPKRITSNPLRHKTPSFDLAGLA